jgi:hypothetical protein
VLQEEFAEPQTFQVLIHELYLKKDLNIHNKIVKVIDNLRKFEFPTAFNYVFRRFILNENQKVIPCFP